MVTATTEMLDISRKKIRGSWEKARRFRERSGAAGEKIRTN
jgi:hypothetical protein